MWNISLVDCYVETGRRTDRNNVVGASRQKIISFVAGKFVRSNKNYRRCWAKTGGNKTQVTSVSNAQRVHIYDNQIRSLADVAVVEVVIAVSRDNIIYVDIQKITQHFSGRMIVTNDSDVPVVIVVFTYVVLHDRNSP